MVIIRPPTALAKKMKIRLVETISRSSTLLGDWHCLGLVIGRQQYILCVSEHGRLPVVLHAAPYASFPKRLGDALSEVLQKIGVPRAKTVDEVSKMKDIVLAKTNSSSILGSMNDFRYQVQATRGIGRVPNDPMEISLLLAETISLVLPDGTPMDSVRKLFGKS